jgi:NAD(P)-dependent dehydrogenase (short-subunit alcohol dehydrogenase family)
VHRKIVNIASTAGIYGAAGKIAYAAATAAVIGMTKTVAREWAPFLVNCNAVAPGLISPRPKVAPLHGVRVQKSFQIYVAGWLRKKLPGLLWTHHSPQFRRAWFATFPESLWPAVEERTDDGRTLLGLKDGTKLLA